MLYPEQKESSMTPEAFTETMTYLKRGGGGRVKRAGIRLAGGMRYIGEIADGQYVVHVVRDNLPPVTVDKAAIVAVDAYDAHRRTP
jgi:hypothetical protein